MLLREKTIGIYSVYCKISYKYYIGYSTDVYERLKTHKRNLLYKKHVNEHLQNAWNLYGEENFEFEVLWECEEEFLASEENYWANLLGTHNKEFGYNERLTHPCKKYRHGSLTRKKISKAKTGKKLSEEHRLKCKNGRKNFKWSEEHKKRISQFFREYKESPDYVDNSKKVYQYDIEGNFIREWKSTMEIERVLNINNARVSDNCRGVTKRCKKYIFKYVFEGDKVSPPKKIVFVKKVAKIHPESGEVLQIFNSASQASINITGGQNGRDNILRVCKKERQMAYDFKWEFV